MNIISYNLNGFRSALTKGLAEWVAQVRPDVLCVQELKAGREPLDVTPLTDLGYHAYLHPAQKPGYSGVATFSLEKPLAVVEGCGQSCYDDEGRVLRLDFAQCSVLNTYMPSGTSGPERQAFKLEWLRFFREYVRGLQAAGVPLLVIAGDYNCCQQEIDLRNAKTNQNSPGFTPEERQWFRDFLADGFTDSFRHHHGPVPDRYSWWTFRGGARARNVGWRLDHLLVDNRLVPHIQHADLLHDVVHSDHCPAQVQLVF